MTNQLDVLLLESRPGASTDAADALEAAGHRVHRCHEPGRHAHPCTELVDPGSCPVEGHVDAALLVGSPLEPAVVVDGLTCAIRAGVPLVEQGGGLFEAYSPWIDRHVEPHGDVVDACADAAEDGLTGLRSEILDHVAQLLHDAGIEPAAVRCRILRSRAGMDVHLEVPAPVDPGLEQRLGVRVLDAVRASGPRTVGHTDVHVHQVRPLH